MAASTAGERSDTADADTARACGTVAQTESQETGEQQRRADGRAIDGPGKVSECGESMQCIVYYASRLGDDDDDDDGHR